MRTIGMLGGMSWQSSAHYYELANRAVAARLGGFHSARCVLASVDFADVEPRQRSGAWDELASMMVEEARKVEAAGAGMLVLCTNTMHRAAGAVEAAIGIPLLHIADATAERLIADGRRRVGLLGTRYTMEQEFYRGRLAQRHGLEVLIPEETERATVDRVIFSELVHGEIRAESRRAYLEVVDALIERGADAVILACTEIGLLVDGSHTDVPLYDTTAIHVEAAVEWALRGSEARPTAVAAAGAGEDRGGGRDATAPTEVVRRLYAARARGDLETVRTLLHPEVVWREPAGEAGYTGVHHGSDAVISDMLGSAMAATDGTFRLELEDVVGHGPLAVALVRWTATRKGVTGGGREVAVYRCADGRVVEAGFHLDDPDATDAFFTM